MVQIHCNEGVAIHIDSESCAVGREETGNFSGVKHGFRLEQSISIV